MSIHSENRPLLGMTWAGALYVDAALPFGLRSAPKIFTSGADTLEWHLRLEGLQQVYHYLDDFLIVEVLRRTCTNCGESLTN